METGERIRQRRNELGMSQDELAKKLGYKDRSSINKIEKGINKLTFAKLKDMAATLETTTSWLEGVEVGQIGLDHHEKAVLVAYRKASPKVKEAIETLLNVTVDPAGDKFDRLQHPERYT